MMLPPLILEMSIPLTRGNVAIIDQTDYHLVSQYRWYASRSQHGWYALAKTPNGDGTWSHISMHALLMGDDDQGRTPDHKNRDGLDNRRANLRWATSNQQCTNTSLSRRNKSGFKGVSWDKGTGKWAVRIQHLGVTTYLGLFVSLEDAARAYDAKAKELHGEFAYLNFPQEQAS